MVASTAPEMVSCSRSPISSEYRPTRDAAANLADEGIGCNGNETDSELFDTYDYIIEDRASNANDEGIKQEAECCEKKRRIDTRFDQSNNSDDSDSQASLLLDENEVREKVDNVKIPMSSIPFENNKREYIPGCIKRRARILKCNLKLPVVFGSTLNNLNFRNNKIDSTSAAADVSPTKSAVVTTSTSHEIDASTESSKYEPRKNNPLSAMQVEGETVTSSNIHVNRDELVERETNVLESVRNCVKLSSQMKDESQKGQIDKMLENETSLLENDERITAKMTVDENLLTKNANVASTKLSDTPQHSLTRRFESDPLHDLSAIYGLCYKNAWDSAISVTDSSNEMKLLDIGKKSPHGTTYSQPSAFPPASIGFPSSIQVLKDFGSSTPNHTIDSRPINVECSRVYPTQRLLHNSAVQGHNVRSSTPFCKQPLNGDLRSNVQKPHASPYLTLNTQPLTVKCIDLVTRTMPIEYEKTLMKKTATEGPPSLPPEKKNPVVQLQSTVAADEHVEPGSETATTSSVSNQKLEATNTSEMDDSEITPEMRSQYLKLKQMCIYDEEFLQLCIKRKTNDFALLFSLGEMLKKEKELKN